MLGGVLAYMPMILCVLHLSDHLVYSAAFTWYCIKHIGKIDMVINTSTSVCVCVVLCLETVA
jgi:hypothetical protein